MGVWDILRNSKTSDGAGIESAKREEGDARAREREKGSGILKLVDSKSAILQEMMIWENRAGRKILTLVGRLSTFYLRYVGQGIILKGYYPYFGVQPFTFPSKYFATLQKGRGILILIFEDVIQSLLNIYLYDACSLILTEPYTKFRNLVKKQAA